MKQVNTTLPLFVTTLCESVVASKPVLQGTPLCITARLLGTKGPAPGSVPEQTTLELPLGLMRNWTTASPVGGVKIVVLPPNPVKTPHEVASIVTVA